MKERRKGREGRREEGRDAHQVASDLTERELVQKHWSLKTKEAAHPSLLSPPPSPSPLPSPSPPLVLLIQVAQEMN